MVLTIYGLLSIHWEAVRWATLLIFLGGVLFNLWNVYFDPINFNKDDWRGLAYRLDSQIKAGDMVITCTDGYRLAFDYYHSHQILAPKDIVVATQINDAMNLSAYQTAWVVNLHYRPPVHNLAKDTPPVLATALLSPQAAAWETRHRRGKIAVAGISAYHYNLGDASSLAEVVQWHCQSYELAKKEVYSQ